MSRTCALLQGTDGRKDFPASQRSEAKLQSKCSQSVPFGLWTSAGPAHSVGCHRPVASTEFAGPVDSGRNTYIFWSPAHPLTPQPANFVLWICCTAAHVDGVSFHCAHYACGFAGPGQSRCVRCRPAERAASKQQQQHSSSSSSRARAAPAFFTF